MNRVISCNYINNYMQDQLYHHAPWPCTSFRYPLL